MQYRLISNLNSKESTLQVVLDGLKLTSFYKAFEITADKKSSQASKGKRIKTSTRVAKPVKKKQLATTSKEKGLNVLSEVAFCGYCTIKAGPPKDA
ncbi:hypothetical protein Tco_0194572 [Tanacetum coccineum]